MRVRTVLLRDLDASLRSAWSELAAVAVEPNPYVEPLAVEPAAELLPGGEQARLLVVERSRELLLALPIQRLRRYRGVPVPLLRTWSHPYCFLGTPLAREDALQEAWQAVLEQPSDVAWLALDRLSLDGPVGRALHEVLAERGASAAHLNVFDRPVLLRRPQQDYLDGRMSARHVKKLRRQRRRLSEALGGAVAPVDHAVLGDATARVAAVDLLMAQELAGWKGRAGTALASAPSHAEYFRRVCAGFAEQSRLQLWSLEGAGRSAATQSRLLAGDTAFIYKIAYDEQHAKFSPGLQLDIDLVEQFHVDHGLQRIESGTEPGNRVFARLYADRVGLATALVPLQGLRGATAVRTAAAVTRGGRLLKRLLQQPAIRRTAATAAPEA